MRISDWSSDVCSSDLYTTIDHATESGDQVPIEDRGGDEVALVEGLGPDGQVTRVRVTQSVAANPAFDITPAGLVTGYITERGLPNDRSSPPRSGRRPRTASHSATGRAACQGRRWRTESVSVGS